MIKFEKQTSPDHKFVVAYDTICSGYETTHNADGDIVLYTDDEAKKEVADIEEILGDDSYFVLHMDDYIHNKKTYYPIGIVGETPIIQ